MEIFGKFSSYHIQTGKAVTGRFVNKSRYEKGEISQNIPTLGSYRNDLDLLKS